MASKTRIPLVIGTMGFGQAGTRGCTISDPDICQKCVDVFRSHGHNEIDTARTYASFTSEGMIAKLDTRGMLYDTKLAPRAYGDHSPVNMRHGLETSLKELKVDRLHIWYLHYPDHATLKSKHSFEDTLREVNDLYKEGKFEKLGLCNYAAWEVAEIVGICRLNCWVLPTVYQGLYNCISRTVEPELLPCIRKFGMRFLAYNPLAGGFLVGEVRGDSYSQRFDPNTPQGKLYRSRFVTPENMAAFDIVEQSLEGTDLTLPAVGLRWLQHHSELLETDSIIIGGAAPEHFAENCEVSEQGPLPEQVLKALDAAWLVVKPTAYEYFR